MDVFAGYLEKTINQSLTNSYPPKWSENSSRGKLVPIDAHALQVQVVQRTKENAQLRITWSTTQMAISKIQSTRKWVNKAKLLRFNLTTFFTFVLAWLARAQQNISTSQLWLRANGRNNSQHCYANTVGSCWVRVGSSVQTDATTPNNVGTCSASREGYNP